MDTRTAPTARAPRRALAPAALLLAAALCSCAGGGPMSGRQVLEDLERDRIPSPAEARQAATPAPAPALPATGTITLADLLNVAEARSPELAAARSGVGAAAGRAWQASLYPNPGLDITTEDISWRDGLATSKTVVGITQPIILGDRRRAAMDSAEAERAARLADVEARRRALFGEIAVEHARLVGMRDRRRLYEESRQLINRTLEAARSRFEARAAPETDVIRPRIELFRLDGALARLGHEETSTAARLGLLLGAEIDGGRLAETLEMTPAGLDAAALRASVASHPALAGADREIEAAAARLGQLRAERTPDLDVRVGVGYRNEEDDGIVELSAGMALPLWDARQGDVLAARFELMRARQERDATRNGLLSALEAAIGEYEGARAQLATFRDNIVPDARRAFDQTGEGYGAGQSTFLDLLEAQRTLTEARLTLTELAAAVAEARAAVMRVVGTELTHRSPGAGAPGTDQSLSTSHRPSGEEVQP